jgi:carbon storage regulator
MLVLDRKLREGFWINGGIFVKVLSIGRERVKLGIEAPTDVRVVRDELRAREHVGARAHRANGADDS